MNAQFHTTSTCRRQLADGKGHGGGITWIARAACEFCRATVLVDVQIARRPHLRVVFSEDTTKTDRQMVKKCIEERVPQRNERIKHQELNVQSTNHTTNVVNTTDTWH